MNPVAKLLLVFLISCLLFPNLLQSQTIVSTGAGGVWSDSSTWVGRIPPTQSADVVIISKIDLAHWKALAIAKDILRSKANSAGIPYSKINPLTAELVDDGTLHEWREKRPGTNPKISFARFPQPEPELIK